MRKIFLLLILAIIFCAMCLENKAEFLNRISIANQSSAISPTPRPKSADYEIPSVKPSNFISEIRKKKKENPNMTAKELADFGNEFIGKYGFDYTFDWIPKGKENEKVLKEFEKGNGEKFYPFVFEFMTVIKKPLKLRLMNNRFDHPCFNVIDLPTTKVDYKTLTLFIEGKQAEFFRPKDFNSEEIVLVDRSLKKTLRKWNVPIDATPVGISEDGRKIYFESWEFYQDTTDNLKETPLNLAVEVSEDGELQLIDKSEIKSGEGIIVTADKKDPEIQFKKYKIGSKEFILNFSNPCT